MGSLPDDEVYDLSSSSSYPHSHVWNTTYAFIASMSLKCAVELGIPEAVQRCGDRPVSLADLAADLAIPQAHAPHLARLMRMLVHEGYFACKRKDADQAAGLVEEGYVLTPSSAYLVAGGGAFVKAMLCLAMVMPHMNLSSWFRGDDDEKFPTSFHATNGVGLWEHAGKVAEFNEVFNAGIAHDADLVGADVISRCGSVVQDARCLVDVGGGNGGLARAIAKAFPHLECIVLDLPHVVVSEMRPATMTDEKVVFVGGNMFEYIPPADVALLKHIMHDYDDEKCVKILKQCKKAISSYGNRSGKVVIIDTVVNRVKAMNDGTAAGDKKRVLVQNQLLLDMEMLAVTGGKEREEKEWANIFVQADLMGGYSIKPILGFLCLIEVFP